MSGGGQQQQPQQQTTQTQSSSGPPAFIQPFLQRGVQKLEDLFNANPNAPKYFPGETIAPFSGETQSAISRLAARGAGGSPVVGSAQQNNYDTTSGKFLDLKSNPYFQDALTASLEPSTRNFNNSVLPAITSQFAMSGRGSSGAHESAVMDSADILARAQAGAGATMGANVYNNERGLQRDAVNAAPALANQDYIDINQLGSAGQTKDNQAQAKIDESIARYNYDNNSQWDYINRYLASVNGGYPGGEYSGTSNTYGMRTTPGSNTFANIFGSGLGLAGLGLQAYSAFSDERLKDDIKPVGKLNDGQTVYSYRYKGDDITQIGLLAQEVEKVRPEAVSVDPASGFKKVHYGVATAGLF